MRSEVFQRVLDDYKSKPLFYRFKIWLKNEIYVIKCLGITKYLKLKIK